MANIRRSREQCKFICMACFVACFVRSSREASDSRIRRAERACKPDGLHCRGVNRISGEAEYRRSREWHGMPRKEGTGARPVCTGGGKSATVSRQIDSLSPEGRARDASRMAVEPRARFLLRGKVLRFSRQIDSLPPPRIQHCSS